MSIDRFGRGLIPTQSPADKASPIIAVVAATGDLDDASAARLLRWCESRLHLLDIGQAPVGHIVIDLSHAHRAFPSALQILDHARMEARRRHVGIHLVGAGATMANTPALGRRHLIRWSTYPTLDAARIALAPQGTGADRSRQRSVDPDSIMLGPLLGGARARSPEARMDNPPERCP